MPRQWAGEPVRRRSRVCLFVCLFRLRPQGPSPPSPLPPERPIGFGAAEPLESSATDSFVQVTYAVTAADELSPTPAGTNYRCSLEVTMRTVKVRAHYYYYYDYYYYYY
jgi:hypothetical protein